MPRPRDEQQVLIPPRTRLTQAYNLAWQRYYGDAPRGLLRTQRTVIPNIRRLAYRHRVRR